MDNTNQIAPELAAALIKARLALKAPGKDGKNPHFKSSYMTLDNLTASVMDAMDGNGLMVMQQPFSLSDEGGLCVGVETIILHTSGQTLSSGRDFFCRVAGGDAQKVGAAITYLRRYGLGALLGVVVEEDDDGNSASSKATVGQQRQAQPTEQKESHPTANTERQPPVSSGGTTMTEREKLLARAKELAEACGIPEVKRQLAAFNADKISALTDAQLPKLITGLEFFLKRKK